MAAQAIYEAEIRRLVSEQPGRALDDYIVKSDMAKTPARWNTMKTSLRRSLAEGGGLHDLVLEGKICATPQEKLRATPKSWAFKAQERPAEFPRELQTQGSRNMLAIVDRVNGGVSPQTRNILKELATLSERSMTEKKWEIASELIDGLVEREAIATIEIKHREELAKKDREKYEDLKQAYEQISNIAQVLAAKVAKDNVEDEGGASTPVRHMSGK